MWGFFVVLVDWIWEVWFLLERLVICVGLFWFGIICWWCFFLFWWCYWGCFVFCCLVRWRWWGWWCWLGGWRLCSLWFLRCFLRVVWFFVKDWCWWCLWMIWWDWWWCWVDLLVWWGCWVLLGNLCVFWVWVVCVGLFFLWLCWFFCWCGWCVWGWIVWCVLVVLSCWCRFWLFFGCFWWRFVSVVGWLVFFCWWLSGVGRWCVWWWLRWLVWEGRGLVIFFIFFCGRYWLVFLEWLFGFFCSVFGGGFSLGWKNVGFWDELVWGVVVYCFDKVLWWSY